MAADNERIRRLRDLLWSGLQDISEIYLNGDLSQSVAGLLNVSFNFIEGEALLAALKGLAVSSGAACTSANPEPSHVLKALGRTDSLARGAIRFSLGRFTTVEEIDYAIVQVRKAVTRLRELSPLWARHQIARRSHGVA
jgi:cysteine desulfurase